MSPQSTVIATLILGLFLLITYFNFISISQISQAISTTDLNCGFMDHFHNWLNKNGYGNYSFDRPDIKCGAYGGKANQKDAIKHIPVIFLHGNSDVGFGRGINDSYASWQTGFRSLAAFLAGKNYQKSQMYTTTWDRPIQVLVPYVLRVRAFIEAIIAYTGALKVNIIGHSMGVTLGRKAIKGGTATDHSTGSYEVASSLKSKIKTFIGLAGANMGLATCWSASSIPTCNTNDGFYPGATPTGSPSTFLNDLNIDGGAEGDKVYTIWSKYDDLIMNDCLVWGKVTCRIPDQDGEIEKNTFQWTHFAVRDNVGPDLINWL